MSEKESFPVYAYILWRGNSNRNYLVDYSFSPERNVGPRFNQTVHALAAWMWHGGDPCRQFFWPVGSRDAAWFNCLGSCDHWSPGQY